MTNNLQTAHFVGVDRVSFDTVLMLDSQGYLQSPGVDRSRLGHLILLAKDTENGRTAT